VAKKSEAELVIKIKPEGSKKLLTLKDRIKSLKPTMEGVKRAAKLMAASFIGLGIAVVKFAEKAGRFDGVQKAFKNLAAAQGKDSRSMLDNMRELSRGTVSDLSLMEKANNALLLGLPVDRFGDMLKIAQSSAAATGQSMEFMLNSIVTGLGRGSKLMLDNLGIIIDAGKAQEEYAAKLGRTAASLSEAERKQAFINKALAIGLDNTKKIGEQSLTLSQQMGV